MKKVDIKAVWEKYKYILVFILGVILADIYIAGNYNGEFYWDASDYWACGSLFGYERLDFRGWYHPFRGYLTSFVWYGIQRFSMMINYSSATIFCFFIAFLHSLTSIILIPDIMKRVFGVSLNCIGRLLLGFCIMYFYKGLLIYPLSDYLAFAFLVLSIYFLLHAKVVKNRWMRAMFLFASGMIGGGGYYIRPVYLATAVVLCIGTLIFSVRKRKIQYFILVLGGVVLVSIPQSISNYIYRQTISPVIKTEYQGGEDLFLQQLTWGITIQRYESSVDADAENVPVGGVRFISERGEALLEKDGIDEFGSYFEYIGFILRHFFSMVLIYGKHLFNGIDIAYNDIYIQNIYSNRLFIQLMNYVLIFSGLVGIAQAIIRKKWKAEEVFLMILWFLPVLLAIPTAVESRFFMNLNIILYYFGCREISLLGKVKTEKITKQQILYFSGSIIFIIICFYLNWTTFNSVGIPLW